MTTKPVLVVHGISNHDRSKFETQVAALQDSIRALLPNLSLIPVFWGDLGGQSGSIVDTLPRLKDGEWMTRAEEVFSLRGTATETAVRSIGPLTNDDRARIIAQSAEAVGVRSTAAAEADVEAIAEALERTTYLQQIDDPETLRAVGEVLREALGSDTSAEEGGIAIRGEDTRAWVRNKIGAAVSAIDRLLGRVVGDRLGVFAQRLRGSLMEGVAATLGDIIAYQADREAVQQRLFDAVGQHAPGFGTDDRPIGVIAHSLGGVISVDAATAPAAGVHLHINPLVTFGSQSAFFEIVKPSNPKSPYRSDHPILLPRTIGKWLNLWSAADILGFTAGAVFRLHDGSTPEDIPVEAPLSSMLEAKLWLHSIYWESATLRDVLGRSFA